MLVGLFVMCCSAPLGSSSRGLATCTTTVCVCVGERGVGRRTRRSRHGGGEQGAGKDREQSWRQTSGGEGQRVRCCQDNSQQRYSLRRTKQNYLREQKSANTCLGGSSGGTEWETGREVGGIKQRGTVPCTEILARRDEGKHQCVSVCVTVCAERLSECASASLCKSICCVRVCECVCVCVRFTVFLCLHTSQSRRASCVWLQPALESSWQAFKPIAQPPRRVSGPPTGEVGGSLEGGGSFLCGLLLVGQEGRLLQHALISSVSLWLSHTRWRADDAPASFRLPFLIRR